MNLMFTPGMTPEMRRQLLEDNADKVEEGMTYQKPLTQEELDLRREQLSDCVITLSELEEEKREVVAEFKTKMDPLKETRETLCTEIKTRQTTITGTVYSVANHDSGFMESYDQDGNLISTRRLRPDEKQGRFYLSKAQ